MKKRVAVVGGGFSGLTAAWELSRRGYKVVLFEKERHLGGLAAGFREKGWSWSLDRFYRHVFASDKDFLRFTRELGVRKKVFFRRPKTGVYFQGKTYLFDSPRAVLSFSPLPFLSRLRLGLGISILKYGPFLSLYEKKTTEQLLPFLIGRRAYSLIWEPLLEAKFGSFSSQIPFSWFWARIKARTAQLGYFAGGFSRLAAKIAREIKREGGEVKKGFLVREIRKINQQFILKAKGKNYYFDKIILATPLSLSLSLAPSLLKKEKTQFSSRKNLGTAVLILRLKKNFLPQNIYWLNILEKNWPFVAVVEQTNFIERRHYGGEYLVYLGGYYPPNHPVFRMKKREVERKFFPYAAKINPRFRHYLIGTEFFIAFNAQPVPEIGEKRPVFRTSTAALFWLNMEQIFPWDRGINFAIKYARSLAREVEKEGDYR